MGHPGKRFQRFVAGSFGLMAINLVGATSLQGSGPFAEIAARALRGAEEWCKDCPGQTCLSSEHAVELFQPMDIGTDDPYHGCEFGSCEAHGHDLDCFNGEENQIALFWQAMEEAEASDLAGILNEFREVAFFNAERMAIQVRGCGGGIIAHLPLGYPATTVQ